MLKVGITGQLGFIGTHLFNTLGLFPGKYERISFEDNYLSDESLLRVFVSQCDVIVHLAAINRHPDSNMIYKANLNLVNQLISAMESEKVTPYVLFSSSIQEDLENEYGNSKKQGRILLERWANQNGASFTGMILPNVYGPFGIPNYNSFIATFSHKLTHNDTPKVLIDSNVQLIYIDNLINYILSRIDRVLIKNKQQVECDIVPFDFEMKVTEILYLFEEFKNQYFDNGYIPKLKNNNEVNLFNTFRSYIEFKNHYPVKLTQHIDPRGLFVETIKLGIGGQVSFSTTVPGITRGNHYHIRKIERFTVIKGKAKIQLRRVGTAEILDFYLDGAEPSYVDMPIWYTHNITNIGDEELYTQFWINEWYDPNDSDTYFESV